MEGKQKHIKSLLVTIAHYALRIILVETMTKTKGDKWLIYQEVDTFKERKTRKFKVVSKHSGEILGEIKWHNPWRKYTFEPITEFKTEYDEDCLLSISNFVRELNEDYKNRHI